MLAAASAGCVGFTLLFTLVVFLLAAWPSTTTVTDAAAHTLGAASKHLWRPDGLLVSFPMMAYGFTAHPDYLGVYQNLQASVDCVNLMEGPWLGLVVRWLCRACDGPPRLPWLVPQCGSEVVISWVGWVCHLRLPGVHTQAT